MGERQYDVVVVGAGYAGLSSAERLRREGYDVLVLEARDRVGGRIWSAPQPLPDGSLIKLDLGGQWVGPTQDHLLGLLDRFGVKTQPTPTEGAEMYLFDGLRLTTLPHDVERVLDELDRLSEDVPLERPWTHPRAEELELPFAEWLRQHATASTARFVDRAVTGAFLACAAGDVSTLDVLFYIRSGGGVASLASCEGGAQELRIDGGAQRVANAIAATLGAETIRFDEPVVRIEQGGDQTVVVSTKGCYQTRHVVVAVPPALAARIDYVPSLPTQHAGLFDAMPHGYAMKWQTVYAEPFWREAGLSGIGIYDEGVISETFDNSKPDENGNLRGILAAFVYGGEAHRLRELAVPQQRELVLEQLATLFGESARHPLTIVHHDWSTDPWTRGCFSAHFRPGGWTSHGPALREPVGSIHWAGTETAVRWNGYIDGAISSGLRAAAEITAAR